MMVFSAARFLWCRLNQDIHDLICWREGIFSASNSLFSTSFWSFFNISSGEYFLLFSILPAKNMLFNRSITFKSNFLPPFFPYFWLLFKAKPGFNFSSNKFFILSSNNKELFSESKLSNWFNRFFISNLFPTELRFFSWSSDLTWVTVNLWIDGSISEGTHIFHSEWGVVWSVTTLLWNKENFFTHFGQLHIQQNYCLFIWKSNKISKDTINGLTVSF